MSTHIQPKTIGDLLVLEVKPGWSKERGTLAAGSVHLFGTVLALVGGVYKPFDPDAVDGSEKVHAVLAEEVDATAAAAPGVVIAGRHHRTGKNRSAGATGSTRHHRAHPAVAPRVHIRNVRFHLENS